jgi:hypothetical protein
MRQKLVFNEDCISDVTLAIVFHFIALSVTTWSDNKVRELHTVYLPWHQWTETELWLDDVGVSTFHSSDVVDLWQSLNGV